MELLQFVFSSSRRTFLWAVITAVGSGLGMVGLLAMINDGLHRPQSLNVLNISLFTLLIIITSVFRVNATIILSKLSQQSIATLRLRLSRNILQAPLLQLEQEGSHKLLAALSSDVMSIANGITRIPFLCMSLAIIIGSLVYMVWLSWWLFLIAVAFIIAGASVYYLPQARALVLLRQARSFGDDLYQHFRAICEGTKELKMHSARKEQFLEGPLQEAVEGFSANTVKAAGYYSVAATLALSLFFVIIGVLVFVLPHYFVIDSLTLMAYVLIFLYIQGPIEMVMGTIPELSKAGVALRKIKQLGLDLKSQSIEPVFDDRVFTKAWKSITLKDVSHSYYRELEENYFQLGPINLTFRAGEIVFLVGGNGSGKTTFAKLLLGLYEPEKGDIYVDEEKVTTINRDDYCQLFSAVFVDFFLFETLLGLDNVDLGNVDLDKKAKKYLAQLQLAHKVSIKNGKFSTTQLSQGQKKRLALLTVYLEDRDFYMFDEWAADQDPVFKKVFYTEILPDLKAKGKTVLVISHDDQYFYVADRQIKLESGQVLEQTNSLKSPKLETEECIA